MNAALFYVVLAIAILAFGFFAFLVGAKSEKARTQKEKGDEPGYHSSILDLVKLTVASVAVGAVTVAGIAITYVLSPASLGMNTLLIGEPIAFIFNFMIFLIVAMICGFSAGVKLQDKVDAKAQAKANMRLPGTFIVFGILTLCACVGRAAAATCMTENMQPIVDIMNWAGADFAPAVLVLILAFVPLIMILLGVRFAGGMLSSLMEGIRDIFSFKF